MQKNRRRDRAGNFLGDYLEVKAANCRLDLETHSCETEHRHAVFCAVWSNVPDVNIYVICVVSQLRI